MKSTLIELPPESAGLGEDSIEFVEAQSVEEIAAKGQIEDEHVKSRLLLPGQSFGPYQILGFIAAGGMGEVYACERIMDDGRRLGPVALKVISPEYMDDWAISQRFKREAQISRAIRSPHVTRVYEFGETKEGFAFLAMEMLTGEELFERMYGGPDFSNQQVVELMLGLLAGLRAVHNSGFIHRDLKPENIFFCHRDGAEDVVKILDFGIAKKRGQKSDPYLSVVGKIYGTPEYIAPEQGLNPDVDSRADLYSAGVIMYELLAGRLPFEAETAYALILAHQNEPVPPLPDSVPDGLQRIVRKSLAKRADDRFQTAEEFAASIRKWQNGGAGDVLDTGDMAAPRIRQDTPNHPQKTPVGGLPSAGDARRKASRVDAFSDAPAPPVQIFSKSSAISSSELDAPDVSEPASALPARTDPGEDGQSSLVATVVTGFVVLLVIAAAIYAIV